MSIESFLQSLAESLAADSPAGGVLTSSALQLQRANYSRTLSAFQPEGFGIAYFLDVEGFGIA